MSWNKTETHVIFACDAIDCEIHTAVPIIPVEKQSDFGGCFKRVQELGWVSFKRTGREWTYHCPKCAEQAAADHAEWNKAERERERIKERNARYSE